MEKRNHYQARLAFGIAVLLQLFALLIPSDDLYPPLVKEWWAQMAFNVSHRSLGLLMSDVFFIGANLLWLVSPFLVRVYGQSKPLWILATVLSVSLIPAMVLWLFAIWDSKSYHLALLLAAVVHLVGMLMARKQEPEQERPA